MRSQKSSAYPSQSCGAWSAEGLARRESEESGPGGCCRGVGKSPGMTQPRMKERESRGREGRKTETGLSSIFDFRKTPEGQGQGGAGCEESGAGCEESGTGWRKYNKRKGAPELDSAQMEMLWLLLVPDLPGKWENMSGRH